MLLYTCLNIFILIYCLLFCTNNCSFEKFHTHHNHNHFQQIINHKQQYQNSQKENIGQHYQHHQHNHHHQEHVQNFDQQEKHIDKYENEQIKLKLKELQQKDTNYLQNLKRIFDGCRKQLTQWVGYNQNIQAQTLFFQCKIIPNKSQPSSDNALIIEILNFYKRLADTGKQFNKNHIDIIRLYLKDHPTTKQALKCLIDKRQTENQYFNQQRKYKYLSQFIREHPNQGHDVLVTAPTMYLQKGKRLCSFFKGFFQYYYLNVLNPSQTLSTAFLRALTVRSDIFNHQDIAHCVSLQTHGDLSTNLESLDINNIYQKIPAALNSVRYLKFKSTSLCQSQSNKKIMKNLQQKLKNINMFNIMYQDYQPYVQIAAQKYGTTQLKLLARRFAIIIQNIQYYQKLSKQQL